jgi:DNA-directed RNA polymerase subunit RPC12/RpoP
MGMAIIRQPVNRTARYQGTVVCKKCDAEFSKDHKWLKGENRNHGTTMASELVNPVIVPYGNCPVCNHKVF